MLVASCGTPDAALVPLSNRSDEPPGDARTAAGAAAAPSPGARIDAAARSADGHCDPEPREGSPCDGSVGYCVLSWGSPGGWSTALWCRGGVWELEEERNLP